MSANAPGICYNFKSEILSGIHALGTTVTRSATTADTIKAALYFQNQSIGPATTLYTTAGEVTGTGYTAGGITVTNATAPTYSSATAYWTPSANLTWTTVTISSLFDTVLLYNASQSNRAIMTLSFAAQVVTAGNFVLTIPANASTTALIQLT